MGNGLFLEHLRAAEMPNIMGATPPLLRMYDVFRVLTTAFSDHAC
jgi:hypothetical protein